MDKLRTRFKPNSAIDQTGTGRNTLAECVAIEQGPFLGRLIAVRLSGARGQKQPEWHGEGQLPRARIIFNQRPAAERSTFKSKKQNRSLGIATYWQTTDAIGGGGLSLKSCVSFRVGIVYLCDIVAASIVGSSLYSAASFVGGSLNDAVFLR